jgi:hypothetical protein
MTPSPQSTGSPVLVSLLVLLVSLVVLVLLLLLAVPVSALVSVPVPVVSVGLESEPVGIAVSVGVVSVPGLPVVPTLVVWLALLVLVPEALSLAFGGSSLVQAVSDKQRQDRSVVEVEMPEKARIVDPYCDFVRLATASHVDAGAPAPSRPERAV